MDAMAQLPLPAGLGAGTFPAKLWSLANDPRVLSVRWDSEARGLLIDRSLFERELLRPGGAQGPAPHAFRATQFRSFVRQLNRYGFRKVPGRAGAAAPGDAGAWVHYTNPWFRRDRPDLLLRIRRRSAANTQRRAAGPEGHRPPPCGSQQLPGPRPLPNERHGRPRFQPLPRERPPLARRPPCSFHLLHRERPGPARREGPSRFQELYGERPQPAERELLRVPPCHFQGFHGEHLLPPRWEGPRSRMQELYGQQPPPLDREVLWMQPCSFQQLHREQQPPASNPPAAPGTSAPHAPAGSAGCAASTASSSAQNAPAQEESPALDLGLEIEKMIREIRNSLPVKAPSAQGNINVAPESPREDPVNRAAAEEASSGTESCGKSSPEPEEPAPPLTPTPSLINSDFYFKFSFIFYFIPYSEYSTSKSLPLPSNDSEEEEPSPKGYRISQKKAQMVKQTVIYLGFERFLKYQTVLVEQDDVEIVVTNTVNPASFLSGNMGEPVIHECLEAIKATYSSCPDLKDTLLRILRPGPPMEAAVSSVEGMLVQLPEKVAIMHIKAHEKVSSELDEENKLVDRKAKEAAKGLEELEAFSSTQKVLWWLETHVPSDSGSLAKEDEDWGNKVDKEHAQEILEEDSTGPVSSERQEDSSQKQESRDTAKRGQWPGDVSKAGE
ncbi:hypothetical protein DUI87_31663 [Hirundo rustica rustica]|uniref:HSF-type DNA-binding domain-containing protein n=1 Tax=Hirundo rustica rustica TaxID=333673 RepID=A0A3M0IZE1_HIRRU|nr:hypothetical protein DUI87_31663 [Hirundo rustica rustica]